MENPNSISTDSQPSDNIKTVAVIAKWIIPVIPENTVLEEHAIIIRNGKIIDIIPVADIDSKYEIQQRHNLKNHVLIPGLINAHTHSSMSLLKGYADDLPLMEWLNNHIWPAEGKHVSKEFVEDGAKIAIAEMIKTGTTCFNDMYFFPEAIAEVAASAGIRASIGLITIDFPSAYATDADDYIEKGLKLFDYYKNHPTIKTAFSPHAPYTVSDEPLKRIATLSHELDIQINIHLHETAGEVAESVEKIGVRPIEHLKNLNMLSPSLNAVHMTQLTDDEIKLIADNGVSVIHCPESNLKLASGFCPTQKLVEAGVNIALGTDGSASNNDLDLLGEAKTAALIAKGITSDASAIPAETALKMATINGAKALSIDHLTGSLEIGKSADITAIDLSGIESQPIYNPISQIIYTGGKNKVSDVWVAGKQLLHNFTLTTLNESELIATAQKWQAQISG